MDEKTTAILFENAKESTSFAIEYYGKYAQILTKKGKNLIGIIQSSRLVIGDGRDDIIYAIEKCLLNCPEVPYDIVAWRGGEMSFFKQAIYFCSIAETHSSALWQ